MRKGQMVELPEYVDGVPNISGSEAAIERALSQDSELFLRSARQESGQ